MTLLVTIFAAIITTVIWYQSKQRDELKIGTLCLTYWGASLMWLVDAVFEYAEQQAAYFNPSPLEMLNDLFLGLCVIAFGLVIWLVLLLIKDPKGVIKKNLYKKF